MATQTNEDQTKTKTRNVTGYIHYNKDDDLTKIFDTLREFRTKHGLKFSHHRDYIFFSVRSEHLNELAKQQPFRISHYRSKSQYKCDKQMADKLTNQSDSFVRMTWNETDGNVQFLSRTTGKIHNQLLQRIFKDSDVSFNRSNYHMVRTQQNNQNNDSDDENDSHMPVANMNKKDSDGYTTVVNRRGRNTTDSSEKQHYTTQTKQINNKKVEVEVASTPKVRGSGAGRGRGRPSTASK
jgi:hypothetical protein